MFQASSYPPSFLDEPLGPEDFGFAVQMIQIHAASSTRVPRVEDGPPRIPPPEHDVISKNAKAPDKPGPCWTNRSTELPRRTVGAFAEPWYFR